MQDPLFICAICGWSTTRKSSYTKHFNTCTDPAKKLKKQTKQILNNNSKIKIAENTDIITKQISISNNEIKTAENTDIITKEKDTQTEENKMHFNILKGAIVELKAELKETDNKISSIINTCFNIEELLIDVKKNLKNVDVDSANTIQKINKIEDILKDKYFKLNLAD